MIMANKNNPFQKCFGCDLTEKEKPLVSIKYSGENRWACLECLPQLIHGSKSFDDYI